MISRSTTVAEKQGRFPFLRLPSKVHNEIHFELLGGYSLPKLLMKILPLQSTFLRHYPLYNY